MIFVGLGANNIFAEAKCRVDRAVEGGQSLNVPVVKLKGFIMTEPIVINFEGIEVSATHQLGDQFEPQTCFTMRLGDVFSNLYGVTEQTGLHVLWKGDIRFQCWFERNK